MVSLKERLLSIEQDFLFALSHGEDAISAFNDRWDTLTDDLSSAVDSATLDSETSLLAHTTATRLVTLADTSVELFNSYNTITSQLMEEVDSMMSNLSLDDYDNLFQASGASTRPSRSHSNSHSSHSLGIAGSFGPKRRAASSNEDVPPENKCKRRHEQPAVRTCSGTVSSRFSKHSREPQVSSESRQTPTSVHLPLSYDEKSTSSPLRSSRKRRLSDADVSVVPLPRKRFHLGPRLHAVSDTFVAHQVPSPIFRPKTPQQPVVGSSTPLDLTILHSPTAEVMVPCQLDLPSDALQCHLGTTDALTSEFNSLLESLFDPPALSTPLPPSPLSCSLAPLQHQGIGTFYAASDSMSTAPSSPQSISSSVSSFHPATPPPPYARVGVANASACEYLPTAINQSPSWLPIPTTEESTIHSIAPAKYLTFTSSRLEEEVTTWNNDNYWTSWFDSLKPCISLPISPPHYLSELGLNISPTREHNGPQIKGFERLGLNNGLVSVTLIESCMT